jgi:hypothetical protein
VITPLEAAAYHDVSLVQHALNENAYDRCAGEGALPTWVFYRDAIYGLDDLLPGTDLPLSSAVRASANFPFGFPVVRIRTDHPLRFSPNLLFRSRQRKTIEVTDGGVLSNSGMLPMFHLLDHHAEALTQRGVLLLIVEASKDSAWCRSICHRSSRTT